MLIDYIANHQAEFWLVLGFILLAIEVITGFSSGIFLFVGLGALVSGGLMSFAILPESWIAGVAATGIFSGIITWLLWKPLNKLQGEEPLEKDNSSDLVGYEFMIESDIDSNHPGTKNYSGLNWKVEIDPETDVGIIKSGERVVVSSVEVGLFRVKPVS